MKFPKIKFKKPGKKTLFAAAAVALVIAFVVIGVSSCNRASYYQLVLDNLSEARFYLKQDESEGLKVQFYSGMREEPYQTNGISEKTTAFGLVNIEPKDKSLDGLLTLDGTLKVGEELITVKLEKNPYGRNFACDIARLVDAKSAMSLTLTTGEETIVFNLKDCMPEGAITWEEALRTATDHHTGDIKKAGKFECYVKIISDPVKGSDAYWYIQFVTQKGKTFFCVVDSGGKVIS